MWKAKALLYFDRLTAHQLAILFFFQCHWLCICIHIRTPFLRPRYRHTNITQQKSPKSNTLFNHFYPGGQCEGYLLIEMAWLLGKTWKGLEVDLLQQSEGWRQDCLRPLVPTLGIIHRIRSPSAVHGLCLLLMCWTCLRSLSGYMHTLLCVITIKWNGNKNAFRSCLLMMS